jgi:RNA recognition motif-containing protein
VNDEMVRAHFSRWGTVSDVYFPRHKKTLKRRPFCFVTFASKEDAQRALAESGLEIGGVPIKNLTMVEDRCVGAVGVGGPLAARLTLLRQSMLPCILAYLSEPGVFHSCVEGTSTTPTNTRLHGRHCCKR